MRRKKVSFYKGKPSRYEDARRHMAERATLSKQIYGLDNDILRALFKLPEKQLEVLFQEYRVKHGDVDGDYIREAWSPWKLGFRGVSGMNAQRLIDLCPKVLTKDTRYDLIGKLYEKTRKKEDYTLEIVLGIDEAAILRLNSLLLQLSTKPFEHVWPVDVEKFVGWLCDDDMVAAKSLMMAIEVERSLIISKIAGTECQRLCSSIKNLDNAVEGNHRIEMPYGTVTVNVRKPGWMEKLKHMLK